jgi:hypothetical protein
MVDPTVMWCIVCGICNVAGQLDDICDELKKINRRAQATPQKKEMKMEVVKES